MAELTLRQIVTAVGPPEDTDGEMPEGTTTTGTQTALDLTTPLPAMTQRQIATAVGALEETCAAFNAAVAALRERYGPPLTPRSQMTGEAGDAGTPRTPEYMKNMGAPLTPRSQMAGEAGDAGTPRTPEIAEMPPEIAEMPDATLIFPMASGSTGSSQSPHSNGSEIIFRMAVS